MGDQLPGFYASRWLHATTCSQSPCEGIVGHPSFNWGFALSLAADVISAVEFDFDGLHLATGDRGGRVVLFERVNPGLVRLQQAHCKCRHVCMAFSPSIVLTRCSSLIDVACGGA